MFNLSPPLILLVVLLWTDYCASEYSGVKKRDNESWSSHQLKSTSNLQESITENTRLDFFQFTGLQSGIAFVLIH